MEYHGGEIPKISEFMDKTFVTLHPEMNIYEAIDIFLKKGVTSAAVLDDSGKLIGILSEKDCLNTLMQGAYEGLPGKSVSEYMTTEVITISPDRDVLSVASMFLKNFFRRLPIVEGDKMVGQITRRDLLRAIQELRKEKKSYNPITGRYEPVSNR